MASTATSLTERIISFREYVTSAALPPLHSRPPTYSSPVRRTATEHVARLVGRVRLLVATVDVEGSHGEGPKPKTSRLKNIMISTEDTTRGHGATRDRLERVIPSSVATL